MIVERWTFPVKSGCEEAAVKTLIEGIEGNTIFTHSYRIYTPDISKRDVVVVEWEYEDLRELQESWEAYLAKPDTPEHIEKFVMFVREGGHREVWNLAAQR